MTDELAMTPAEVSHMLDDHVRLGVLRGWSAEGGRYIVHWSEVHDPAVHAGEPETPHAVMTRPQVCAFLCGVAAGMGWVSAIARQVRAEQAADRGVDAAPEVR